MIGLAGFAVAATSSPLSVCLSDGNPLAVQSTIV